MQTVTINGVAVSLNKNEVKEAARIVQVMKPPYSNNEYAQRTADIWIRSAPTTAAQERRKIAVRALGLSDEIKFL